MHHLISNSEDGSVTLTKKLSGVCVVALLHQRTASGGVGEQLSYVNMFIILKMGGVGFVQSAWFDQIWKNLQAHFSHMCSSVLIFVRWTYFMFLPTNQNKKRSLPLPKTRTIIFHILLFSRSFSSKIMFLGLLNS